VNIVNGHLLNSSIKQQDVKLLIQQEITKYTILIYQKGGCFVCFQSSLKKDQ